MGGSTLFYMNVTKTLTAGAANGQDFKFTVPVSGVCELYASTFWLRPDSSRIKISNVRIRPYGQSRAITISDPDVTGNNKPNIKEFAGDGQNPRPFAVIDAAAPNSDIIIQVQNLESSTSIEVSLTLVCKLTDILEHPKARGIGHLFLNNTISMAPADEKDFVITVPNEQIAIWKESTGFLYNSTDGIENTRDIIIKSIKLVRAGEKQKTDILVAGTMNFLEFFGNGKFTREIEVRQQLLPDSDLVFRILNDTSTGKTVEVSVTHWFQTMVRLGEESYRAEVPETAVPVRVVKE